MSDIQIQESCLMMELYGVLLQIKEQRKLSASESHVFVNLGGCIGARARYMRGIWCDAANAKPDPSRSSREGELEVAPLSFRGGDRLGSLSYLLCEGGAGSPEGVGQALFGEVPDDGLHNPAEAGGNIASE